MDPATAAGLALGVLPLIVSVLENYEHIFQPLFIFTRDCRKEVEIFQLALKVQRAAFNNQCLLLLGSVTTHRSRMPGMFRELDHLLWKDISFHEQLRTRLGESFDACTAALTLIKHTLEYVVQKYGGLELLLKRSNEESEKRFFRRLKRLRQRSKISFTKADIDDTISRLRKGNDDLERLSRQMDRLDILDVRINAPDLAPKNDFWAVQTTSARLHQVLSELWSCPAQHSVNISLETRSQKTVTSSASESIGFNLAWKCFPCGQTPDAVTEPMWLAVEAMWQCTDSDVDRHCAREKYASGAETLIAALRDVSLDKTSSPAPTIHPSTAVMTSPTVHLDLDLRSIQDLCVYIKDQQQRLRLQEQERHLASKPQCVGFFQDSSASKYFIFSKVEHAESQPAMSLEEVFCKAKNCPFGITPVDKMYLAKILSTAVLQYHSTPWLDNEWRSADILFFGIHDLDKDALSTPYLCTRSITPTGTPSRRSCIASYSDLAPNTLLYSLGIMLIELAYAHAITDMQVPGDCHPGDSPSFSQHRTALRLAGAIGKHLNVKYETVVKRCLRCSFDISPQKVGLDDPVLQKAVYQRVVCELDHCFQQADMFRRQSHSP